MVGNIYANSNPFLLSIAIIWHKWHNVVADRIRAVNPAANDEIIFQKTKAHVIGQFQSVIFYEWLPQFIPLSDLRFLPGGTIPAFDDGKGCSIIYIPVHLLN